MKKSAIVILLILSASLFSCKGKKNDSEKLSKAQKQEAMENKSNRVSPPVSVIDTINGNIITINYGSPKVKGRVIWNGLVPYNEVWRTGANEATTISFTKDVFVEGQPLKQDTYSLFTLPAQDIWAIIFNLTENQWGAFKYDATQDALRVNVKPMATDSLLEDMRFYILPDATNPNAGIVRLWWEKLQVDFHFENAPGE